MLGGDDTTPCKSGDPRQKDRPRRTGPKELPVNEVVRCDFGRQNGKIQAASNSAIAPRE